MNVVQKVELYLLLGWECYRVWCDRNLLIYIALQMERELPDSARQRKRRERLDAAARAVEEQMAEHRWAFFEIRDRLRGGEG